jgi:hypothetical protein
MYVIPRSPECVVIVHLFSTLEMSSVDYSIGLGGLQLASAESCHDRKSSVHVTWIYPMSIASSGPNKSPSGGGSGTPSAPLS